MIEDQRETLRLVSTYVPHIVLRRALTLPTWPPPERQEQFRAALLFADISGFTPMSESLAELGKEGAEELNRVLGGYFSTMIDTVRDHGGQVVKFGGDAIACLFAGGEDEGGNLLRTCACALAMQGEMTAFQAVETQGGVFRLRMKIGISAGLVRLIDLGDRRMGQEYVLAGRPLDRMAAAEHHATAGEVVIDGDCIPEGGTTRDALDLAVDESQTGFRRLVALHRELDAVPGTAPDLAALDAETVERTLARLVPYLPPTVYEQIVAGQRGFVGEHRRVVSLFVNFFGLDYDGDPAVGQKLQRYFELVQGIVHRYGGRLNRVTTGDKGSVLHIIFGAPVTHEDNEARAVGSALEMQRRVVEARELPFIADQRVGIASGFVFAGNVGSDRRHEYTVLGDVVNLSARLMQGASPGGVLADHSTARQVETSFVCQPLAPIRVKGKREPVPVCQPLAEREETGVLGQEGEGRRSTPLVGRAAELETIRHIIAQAAEGQGQLLVINGEAGVGKSRLLAEVIALARERGMTGVRGDCLSYGAQSPYLPWIELLNAYFGLDGDGGGQVEERVRWIERRMVAADPALGDWVPLIAQLLGLPAPDNELTASLNPQLRKQRTFDIVLTLLRDEAQRVPLYLVVFEDVHWIDAISLEMLDYVARNIGSHPILLVALHRPTIELTDWERYDYHHYLELTDLPSEDALELVKLRLGMAEVPPSLHDRVVRGGERVNPFFVEELVNALIDRGVLQARDGGYAVVGDMSRLRLPDSVQALVMSRVDRLDESSKLTVKVASVIGRTFKYRPLRAIYPVEITPDRLRQNLERLSRLDLTPLDRPAPEWEYIFKHITTQEVAYESLLYAHRRQLHRRMGEYLERTYIDSPEEAYELMAHHYSHSGEAEKSWTYLVKAGHKAKEKYANEAAIAHYTDALAVGADRPDAHEVHEALGDVYRLVGQYEQALASYRRALERVDLEAAQAADVQRKIASTWELQGQYGEAMRHLEQARETLIGHQTTPEMARIYNDMGWVAMRQGKYGPALAFCQQGIDIVRDLSDEEATQRILARLEHTQGTVNWRKGDYPQAAAHFERCIEMQQQIGNRQKVSSTLNNLAVVYWSQSDYDQAAEYLRRSLDISREIGDTYGTAMCYNNLGVISYTLGDTDQAIEAYRRSLEIRQEIGDSLGIADVYTNLGEVYHALEEHRTALAHLQRAADLFRELGNDSALFDVTKLLAQVELAQNDLEEALAFGQRALDLAHAIGNPEFEGIALRVLGQAARAAGQLADATAHLERSVETLATVGNKLELGRSAYELGVTRSRSDPEAGRKRLRQAIQIFEELGVGVELEKARAAYEDLP
jgi:predicted ATPase/class 3 adenylate cyclase